MADRYALRIHVDRTVIFEAETQEDADRWAEEFIVGAHSGRAEERADILRWTENETYDRPRLEPLT